MGHLFGSVPSLWTLAFLVVALGLALGFECINDVYLVGESIGTMISAKIFTDPAQMAQLSASKKELDGITKFIPLGVKFAVALCLGTGTMVGWKRVMSRSEKRSGRRI